MFGFFDDPGPCPVCGAAHSACVGDRDSAGIGVTRGVVVIQQLPARDASIAETSTPAADTAADPAPETAPASMRRRKARPIRRAMTPERSGN